MTLVRYVLRVPVVKSNAGFFWAPFDVLVGVYLKGGFEGSPTLGVSKRLWLWYTWWRVASRRRPSFGPPGSFLGWLGWSAKGLRAENFSVARIFGGVPDRCWGEPLLPLR